MIELEWKMPCVCPYCGYDFDMVEWGDHGGIPAEDLKKHEGAEMVTICPECERHIEFMIV